LEVEKKFRRIKGYGAMDGGGNIGGREEVQKNQRLWSDADLD
jgi:hypothetical protein